MRPFQALLFCAALLSSHNVLAQSDSDAEASETASNTGSLTESETESKTKHSTTKHTKSTTSDDDDDAGPTNPTVVLTNSDGVAFYTGTRTDKVTDPTAVPTGAYSRYSSRITLSNANDGTVTTPTAETPTESGTSSTSAKPTNTQPCNNYVELCSRKYSNITNVGCHNSPFVRPGNSGSNQELPVKTQLDDGVRFLQGQIQFPTNGTKPHFCHTSCDLLDAGPINEWLSDVTDWVSKHPYDVVTVLLGNGNYSHPSLYAPYINQSGIIKYTYEAPYLPMKLDDWPTLEWLILHGKRVIMFMDYEADQEEYPWLLDEFSQVWETPFDPTNRSFPCTVQRPPDLSDDDAKDRLYLMNHNLNVEFNVFGTSLLVPAVSLLNTTNNVTGEGSLGSAANNCRSDWGRAPNFLNVDYYNYGSPPGSVFEVAAQMNNVTYDWDCCGSLKSAASPLVAASRLTGAFAALAALLFILG